jgi:iron complex transport system ATP-binding protein
MAEPVLQLHAVDHRFPESDFILTIPELDIRGGEHLAVIGPNGAGKTTLLRVAAGILPPDNGTVRLQARDLSHLDRRSIARGIGYLPQDLSSDSDYLVEELVMLGRYPHLPSFGNSGARDREIAEESLEATEAVHLQHRRLSHLSGGERKRAFLASVLAQRPQVLLLDEPAASLDLHRQVHFFRLLTRLVRNGLGVVTVTHDLNLASLFSNRILLLKDGRAAAQGAPADVLTPANLESIYGADIWLGKHPQGDRPVVLPKMEDTSPDG